MQVDADLNGGMLRQNFTNRRLHSLVCPCDLPLAVDHVILPVIMQYPDAIFLLQNPLQLLSCAPDALGKPLTHVAVGKAFMGMGMKNQYFWLLRGLFYAKIKLQCFFCVNVRGKQGGTAVNDVIAASEVGKIPEPCHLLCGNRKRASALGDGRCLGKFHILRTENLCGKRFCLFCVREEGSRSLSRQNLCHGKCAAPHAEEEGQCQQKKHQTCQI